MHWEQAEEQMWQGREENTIWWEEMKKINLSL